MANRAAREIVTACRALEAVPCSSISGADPDAYICTGAATDPFAGCDAIDADNGCTSLADADWHVELAESDCAALDGGTACELPANEDSP